MTLLDRVVGLALPAVPKPIVRYFSKRYIAGTSVDDALSVVRTLRREGAMATLDILGEFIESIDEADANAAAYVALVRRIADEGLPETNVSVKLTAFGLLLDRGRCLANTRELVRVAAGVGNFVRIDMEDSPCTSATLEIYRTLRAEFPGNVGVVLQSRLRRTLADVESLTTEPANFRLCKGIYLEPRDVAYTDPELIRSNFTLVLERMLERQAYVGIATHDERLVFEATKLLRKYSVPRERYEFQMLLGVEEELRRIVLREGHRLRVYIPFGEQWYAYSVRRLRENPQIAGYAFKAIFQRATPTPNT
ncbi:MAG TPA: proline dehydrogenase family protein [Candidatus Polarisedimenticolaceae bacterium]|nr:proline dehydrogenase family protein [Candidatus Polarisedimenticolaceae bacterium]